MTAPTVARRRRQATTSIGAQARTSMSGRQRLPRAFMNKAGFAYPNCEYDKKEFLEPVQKIGNLKFNPPVGPVHLKSTHPETGSNYEIPVH